MTEHPYPPYSVGEGNCAKCGANEIKVEYVPVEGVGLSQKDVLQRMRKYVPAEAERREYQPVFVGGPKPSYTNQPPQQPDRFDEIIHAAKPERIHHTCGVCGYMVSTLCRDASDGGGATTGAGT